MVTARGTLKDSPGNFGYVFFAFSHQGQFQGHIASELLTICVYIHRDLTNVGT